MPGENKIASRIFGKHLKIEEETPDEERDDIDKVSENKPIDEGMTPETNDIQQQKGDDSMTESNQGEVQKKQEEKENVLYLQFDQDSDEQNQDINDGALDDLFIEFEDEEHTPVPFKQPEAITPEIENEVINPVSEEQSGVIERTLNKTSDIIVEDDEKESIEVPLQEDSIDFNFDDEKEENINIDFDINDDNEDEELKLDDLVINDDMTDEFDEIKFDSDVEEEVLKEDEVIDLSEQENLKEDVTEDFGESDLEADDEEIDFGFDVEDDEEEHIMAEVPDEDVVIEQPATIKEEPMVPIDARTSGKEDIDISIDEDMVDEIVDEDIKKDANLKVNFSEEEEIMNELTADYDELQNTTSVVKEFIRSNIKLLTKERVCIILEDKEITLTDYKSFFEGKIEEKRREKIYNRIREIEMQYLFENYIKCFDCEGFSRKKLSVDNRVIKNIVKLSSEVQVDVYTSPSSVTKAAMQKGEIGFIISPKLELDFDEYLNDIRSEKLNCENVYLVVLSGTVIDEAAFKNAEKYGVRILKMDVPISIINKTLEDIKRKLK